MAHAPDADFIALQAALAGEYSLDREIGRGGMGIVYLAREVRLARPVAIKVLPPHLAVRADLRDAFLRESRTVAGLNHPNIVPVYAVGEHAGYVCIVMAFVDGTTLGERIRARGPLLPGQAARVLREVAWALAYAHGARIVHRDVSAENILLERGGERAIVTDFGIASAMQTSALDDEGRVMGNAHYVSPEQASGEPVDARSDLYSLGVVGYYALTGRLPFTGDTSAEIVAQHLTTAPPSITSLADAVPPRLAAAVERCLHKDPARRYNSAESFAEAIDLAFEHAKEIPAPLRSWISQGEKEVPARLAIVGIGVTTSVTFGFAFHAPWMGLIPAGVLGTMSLLPTAIRLRRVLSEGYHVDDLHTALREQQLARGEEIEYERRQSSPVARRWLAAICGVSAAGTALGAFLWYETIQFATRAGGNILSGPTMAIFGHMQMKAGEILLFSIFGLLATGVPLAGEFFRHRLANRIASAGIAFWKGKWGKRAARIAGLGLDRAERPMLGMPVLTEIALGRATDHLFNALPKSARRELSVLPETVRRLEADASKVRETINALDDQLSAFERGGDALQDATRLEMADDLRAARALSAERLAQTVAALESIRLDLLRLQMGSGAIESVTASLAAAKRVGDHIVRTIESRAEVECFLRDAQPRTFEAMNDAPGIDPDEDDADTPIGGVPVAHV
jgi:serine/threonine-protein kinase